MQHNEEIEKEKKMEKYVVLVATCETKKQMEPKVESSKIKVAHDSRSMVSKGKEKVVEEDDDCLTQMS